MATLIRKYSTWIAVLIILMACFAAPYLTTEDPDSTIFRSGSFAFIMFLVCIYPVSRALTTQPLRALIYGFGFGLVFTVCQSLGAELLIYDGLLPGTGSLIRRLAVPVMSAPLLGIMVSYAFTVSSHESRKALRPIPFAWFFLLFVLCYGAVLLALWPGVISYDFQHEIKQYTDGIYQAAHPVFHTLMLGNIYALGEMLFGSMTAGAALYSAVQLLLIAAMYAWACTFIQQRTSSRFATLLITAGFAFLPFHAVLAVSTAKDPLFSGLCVILCLLLWEISENPSAFLESKWRIIRFTACCTGMALLRHNGIFAYFPACAALLVTIRTMRKKMLSVVSITLLLTVLLPKGLELSLGATSTPSSEMMSVPCQQLMRTANRGMLPENEFNQIERWFPGATHTYRPHCADPAKGGNFNFARYQEYPIAFWKTYVKYGLKYPRVYLEAFLENSVGLWYPDDISHAHSLSNEEWEYIYLNTVYPFDKETYAIEPECKFPALQKLIYATMHDSRHQNVPFLSQLYCPATYSFLLLLLTLRLCFQKRRRMMLCALPLWGIFISILFSAGVFIRYAYPIMAAVPVLLVLAYFTNQQTE